MFLWVLKKKFGNTRNRLNPIDYYSECPPILLVIWFDRNTPESLQDHGAKIFDVGHLQKKKKKHKKGILNE